MAKIAIVGHFQHFQININVLGIYQKSIDKNQMGKPRAPLKKKGMVKIVDFQPGWLLE